ncbi:MAG: transposase [Bryobacteraceae bacterium]
MRRFRDAHRARERRKKIDGAPSKAYRLDMFRTTSPQRPLFGVESRLDATKRARLERTWAHQFRGAALPLIDENRFARFFDDDNGRPNKSVRLVVGVLILKEGFDLTDEEALEQLEWNTAWHYALDVLPEDAHTCQKTLHNFRGLLLKDNDGGGLFESTTARLVEAAGLRTGRQRQDSTHILSNIRLLTRLGLFVETITGFLEALRKEHPRLCAKLPEELRERYLDREGYFGDARGTEAPRRLEQAALDVYALVRRFDGHRAVSRMEAFVLLRRLYTEQCVPPTTKKPDKIELQEKPSSSSLQSPSDPDVTYGHKGKGYEVQLTETCVEGNPFQVVTAVSVNGANESDQHHVVPALEQTERTCGAAPEELHTDAGYASGDNILRAKEHGTNLLAPIGSKGPDEERGNLGHFDFDEAGEQVTSCPIGNVPVAHQATRGMTRLAIFSPVQCHGCPLRDVCPTETRGDKRVLPFRATDVAVARRRTEQESPEFKERHKIRSGIEATNSELKRCHGVAKLRVRRKSRVSLSVRLKVLAMNVKRYVEHLARAAAAVSPVPACSC